MNSIDRRSRINHAIKPFEDRNPVAWGYCIAYHYCDWRQQLLQYLRQFSDVEPDTPRLIARERICVLL
jgi:hypothetical protein